MDEQVMGRLEAIDEGTKYRVHEPQGQSESSLIPPRVCPETKAPVTNKTKTPEEDPVLHFHDNPSLTYFQASSHPFSHSPLLHQTNHPPPPRPCPPLPDRGFVSLIEANSRPIRDASTLNSKLCCTNLTDKVLRNTAHFPGLQSTWENHPPRHE